LEGPEAPVRILLEKILDDPRHQAVLPTFQPDP